MTATRPEQGGSPHDDAYGEAGSFEAAVDRLDDPLNDPLPGQHPSPWFRAAAPAAAEGPQGQQTPQATQAPRAPQVSQAPQASGAPQAPQASAAPQAPQEEWYDPQGYQRDWYGEQEPQAASYDGSYQDSYQDPISQAAARQPAMDASAYEELYDRTGPIPAVSGETVSLGATAPANVSGETVGLRRPRTRTEEPVARLDDETVGLRTSDTRRALTRAVPGLSRLEARRAERAKRPSPAVLASRALGEVFISIGVLMLLFVTYQLWWTNIRADQQAGAERNKIEQDWAEGKRQPGSFEPGQGFAIMHIPKLDVVVPIAEGINKPKVLDRGMVGHYGEDSIKTAMPEDKQGNFAVAGHRNTHGEPFRFINKLKPGDPIVVETQDKYYVYKMASILPSTSPGNVDVLNPIPKGSGFTKPGRYLTLTTCTPEFTSTYRMIVWGELAEERPRDKGKPDALVE